LIDDLINEYGKILESKGILTPTYLLYELMNELSDEQLFEMDIDIIDVAEKVYYYIEERCP